MPRLVVNACDHVIKAACNHNARIGLWTVVICQFAKRPFLRFIEERPNVLRRINEFAARELSLAQDQMVLLGRRSAEEKVATFLVSWRDRLARLGPVTATVPLPMSRQDIADFLGLTIETVSRTFTKLERDGVIEILPGSVRLADPRRAEALAARILTGQVPLRNATGGATNFHSISVTPEWADTLERTTQIGNHIFYRGTIAHTRAS